MINLCGLRLSADSWKLIGAAFAKAVYVRSFVVSHCNLHKLALESITPHIGKNVTLETIDWSSNDIDDTYSGTVALYSTGLEFIVKILQSQTERRDHIVWLKGLRGESAP